MLSEYNNLYDIYHDYSGINNLKTVNDKAGVEPVEVDRRIIDLLKFSLEVYELTGGEVNVMMGAVLKLWHDAREGDKNGNHVLPTEDELLLANMHTDIEALVIDEAAGTVYISDPEASLDVGAIAKGYATERIAEALIADTSLSTDGYALNIGGNIRIIGSKRGEDFKIGITNPDKSSDEPYVAMVAVRDTSVVTSGDYERYFTVDGKKYHHVIDKDTLQPSVYFHSVTVITRDSAMADALTTALFSMHINDGYALVESMPGVEAMWVGTNGTTVKSSAFPETGKTE
jgi:thiamine biosynthesis lipoprotein